MKKNNVLLFTISLIILAFVIIMGFVLSTYSVRIVRHNDLILYMFSKVLYLIVFLVIVGLGIIKQKSRNYFIQYSLAIIAQFIPLAIRYLSLLKKGFVLSIILFFISCVILCGIEIGIAFLDKKTKIATKKLQGEMINKEDKK